MVVSVLTGAGHREADAGRVPRADARNLAQTPVGLAGQAGHTPTGDDALGSVTLRGSQHVDALVLYSNQATAEKDSRLTYSLVLRDRSGLVDSCFDIIYTSGRARGCVTGLLLSFLAEALSQFKDGPEKCSWLRQVRTDVLI